MRDTHRCPDCGARRIWHVAEVKDKAVFTGPFVIWSGQTALARAELYVCGDCGRVEWFAVDLSSDATAESAAEPCAACEGLRFVAVPAYDAIGETSFGRQRAAGAGAESLPMSLRIEGDDTEGRLALRVCLDCARVFWQAPERGDVGRAGDTRETGRCAVCGADERWRIPSRDLRSMQYTGGILSGVEQHLQSDRRAIAIRAGLFLERSWGTLDVIVCAPCGAVTWSARGMDELREDPAAGVRLVEVPEAKGPYR